MGIFCHRYRDGLEFQSGIGMGPLKVLSILMGSIIMTRTIIGKSRTNKIIYNLSLTLFYVLCKSSVCKFSTETGVRFHYFGIEMGP